MRTPMAVGDTHTMTYVVPENRCVPDVFLDKRAEQAGVARVAR